MKPAPWTFACLLLAADAFAGGGGADLRLSLQDGPDPIPPTMTLRYTIVVQNGGPDAATDVSATVTLPPGVLIRGMDPNCSAAGPSSVTCVQATLAVGAEDTVGAIETYAPPGLTGPLTASATVTSATPDPDPTSNLADTTTQTAPGLRIVAPPMLEGDSGIHDAGIVIELLPDGSALPAAVTVDWQTASGNATSGVDFVPGSGTLTFSASVTSHPIAVGVIGDTVPEISEVFFILLTNAQGALPIPNPEGPVIVNDDTVAGAANELSHGIVRMASLESGAGPVPPQHLYRVVAPPRTSMEVLVDAPSGDLTPLALERLAPGGGVLQSAAPVGTGPSVSLRWRNAGANPIADEVVRVRSGGCTTDCGPDDVYRIRAYDTTARVPRFNNSVSQFTILLLQNPTGQAVSGSASLWDSSGAWIADMDFALAPHGAAALNTSQLAAGRSGSITLAHTAPYGLLQGKAVSIEPATGFSFDSPFVYRPR